jgi:hypothetical protein
MQKNLFFIIGWMMFGVNINIQIIPKITIWMQFGI